MLELSHAQKFVSPTDERLWNAARCAATDRLMTRSRLLADMRVMQCRIVQQNCTLSQLIEVTWAGWRMLSLVAALPLVEKDVVLAL